MSNEMMDGFEEVQTMSTTWEPKQTGKKKDNNVVILEASDEKSWIAGYYLETEEGKGPKGNSTIHKFKILRNGDKLMVGDKKHLSGNPKETNDIISIWGTGVLNGRIAEHVKQGQAVKITWKGKVPSKKGGDPYHTWAIAVNNSIEPLSVSDITAPTDEDDEFSDDATPLTAPEGDMAPVETKSMDDDFEDDEDF